MNQSSPRRLLLVLALVVLVLGSVGCARTTTPTPESRVGATPTVIATAAAAAPQVRPTATPTRAPVAGPTTAPIATATAGGLAIATPPPGDRMQTVKIDRLPAEALDTMRLIARNGPYPYRQDGVMFENRERLLPAKATGYYREYTVKTPGSPDRGARRLVRGGQGELYYTDDHYDSFRRVTP